MKKIVFLLLLIPISFIARSQDVNVLVQKIKDKIGLVNNYQANGKMKTNIVFLKVPVASVKLYFKKPDQLLIKNEKGISFIPKTAVNINLNNVLNNGKYNVIDAGIDKIGSTVVTVVKLLPEDDNADVVLSTLYIDPVKLVVIRSKTTTRDNGTYELNMRYGKYISYGLPDKVIFSFNTKDYKMPKGVTFDFEDGTTKKTPDEKLKNQKGKVEITISSYTINKGISDAVFK